MSTRFRPYRFPLAIALMLSATLIGIGSGSAVADVTAVNGSAYGFFANVSLFGGPFDHPGGPQPKVTLPAAGSSSPVTATDPACGPSGSVTACTPGSSSEAYTRGPAHIFESGPTTVSTQATLGPTGSVVSSADIAGCTKAITNSCNAGEIYAGPFTASHITSSCSAGASNTGSVTITNGMLVTKTDANGDPFPGATVSVPDNPAPNTVMKGTIDQTGINGDFQWTFNEQITNADGSITINAAHEILGFSTPASPAHGDLIIGQVVCGVTGTQATTTTTTTTTPGATTTTTTTPGATTTTTGSTTTTTAPASVKHVIGSAYGFFGNVGLFGGAAVAGGPQPTVSLPPDGSATALTATDPPCGPAGSSTACTTGSSSEAYTRGPAHIFESGPITVSTKGLPGAGGSATSSAKITGCGQAITNSCGAGEVYGGPFTAKSVDSTCKADATGLTGSTTISGGVIVTSTNTNGDPLTTTPVAASPPANTVVTGTINTTGVNGSFKWTFNEQIANPDGSLTVNAGHEILGASGSGPAKGDLIIGQVICGAGESAGTGTTTTTVAQTTTTGAATTTTAPAAIIAVGGSAYGFYTSVGLFGGAQAVRGPSPKVTLPAGGSATPVTATDPSLAGVYGPAHIFEAGPGTVSTEGTPGASGSVTSKASIQGCTTADLPDGCKAGEVYAGPLTATSVTSTCTASASGMTGSVTFAKGVVVTLDDAAGNAVTTVPLPDPVPPNYTLFGKITNVQGAWKYVFNEQTVDPKGSITVNAGHEYLGGGPGNQGPAAGDLIYGHVVCIRASAATLASAVAATGIDAALLVRLALWLLAMGCTALWWAGDEHRARPE